MDSSTTEYELTRQSTFHCETDFESDSLERQRKPILRRILRPIKAKVGGKPKVSEDISGPTDVDGVVASDNGNSTRSCRADSLLGETNVLVDTAQHSQNTNPLLETKVGGDHEQDPFPRGRSRVRGERSRRANAAAIRQKQMNVHVQEPVQPIHIVESTVELEGRKAIVLTDDLVKRFRAVIKADRNMRLVQQDRARKQTYYQDVLKRINKAGDSLHARQVELDYSLIEDATLGELEYKAIRQRKLALISLEKTVIKKHQEATKMLRNAGLKQVKVNSEINRLLEDAFLTWHMIKGRPKATQRHQESLLLSDSIDLTQLENIEGLLSYRVIEPRVPDNFVQNPPNDQPGVISSTNVNNRNHESHAATHVPESNEERAAIHASMIAFKLGSRKALKGWAKRQKLNLPALKLVKRKNRSRANAKRKSDMVATRNALSDKKDQLHNVMENIRRFEDQGMVHQHAEFRIMQTRKINSLGEQIKKLQADVAKDQSGDGPGETSATIKSTLPHGLRLRYPDLATEYFDKSQRLDCAADSVGGESLDLGVIDQWLKEDKADTHEMTPNLADGDSWEAKSVGFCQSVEVSARGGSRKLIDWWRRTAENKGQLQSEAVGSEDGDGAALTTTNVAGPSLVPQNPGSSAMAATFGQREADRNSGRNAVATPESLVSNKDSSHGRSLGYANRELHRECVCRFLDFADGS